MKSIFCLCIGLLILSSCLDKRRFNQYVGEWSVTTVSKSTFSADGTTVSATDSTMTGTLVLLGDSTFTHNSTLDGVASSGRWSLRTQGKDAVIYFWNGSNMQFDFNRKFTVTSKTKTSLQLLHITIDEDGKPLLRLEYTLTK